MAVNWYYTIFGLSLRSDQPIPGLVAQPEPAAVDVEVCHEGPSAWGNEILEMPQALWHTGLSNEPGGEPCYKAWPGADTFG